MNKMTLDEQIEIVRAHADGKQLEQNVLTNPGPYLGWIHWEPDCGFKFHLMRYRVKPRKPREWWCYPLGVYQPDGYNLYRMTEDELEARSKVGVIRVREVLSE